MTLILVACGGTKKTQEAINTGNYSVAIDKALKKLSNNKTKKGNQQYITLLEEAFLKNKKTELERISFLKKDGNPSNLENMYTTYLQLRDTQNKIKPLLPLSIYNENRDAKFDFDNYDSQIVQTKSELSNYLYTNASNILNSASTKIEYRNAYEDFKYLDEINPGYKNTAVKINEAYEKGLDYVKIELRNQTDQIIPARLEE